MRLTEEETLRLHRLSSHSKDLLKTAFELGCFSCLHRFTYDDIEQFVDFDQTALCPFCDIDAVIPLDDLGKESERQSKLEAMHDYFF